MSKKTKTKNEVKLTPEFLKEHFTKKWTKKLRDDKVKEPLFSEQLKWYVKLSLEGYVDLEIQDVKGITQKQSISTNSAYHISDDHYEMLEQMVNDPDFKFARLSDRLIIDMRSKGASVRKIERELLILSRKSKEVTHLSYVQVSRIVHKYVKLYNNKAVG